MVVDQLVSMFHVEGVGSVGHSFLAAPALAPSIGCPSLRLAPSVTRRPLTLPRQDCKTAALVSSGSADRIQILGWKSSLSGGAGDQNTPCLTSNGPLHCSKIQINTMMTLPTLGSGWFCLTTEYNFVYLREAGANSDHKKLLPPGGTCCAPGVAICRSQPVAPLQIQSREHTACSVSLWHHWT